MTSIFTKENLLVVDMLGVQETLSVLHQLSIWLFCHVGWVAPGSSYYQSIPSIAARRQLGAYWSLQSSPVSLWVIYQHVGTCSNILQYNTIYYTLGDNKICSHILLAWYSFISILQPLSIGESRVS